MICRNCRREVTSDDQALYCPYCGLNLTTQRTQLSLFSRHPTVSPALTPLILFLLLFSIIAIISLFLQPLFHHLGLRSAPISDWLILLPVAGIAFYFTIPYFVYTHAKAHHRRAVAWATAFAVFTPVLAGIAYLLTWPKD